MNSPEGQIKLTSTIVVSKDQVSAELTGEAIILNSDSGIYYQLNAVGVTVWNSIQQPLSVKQIIESVLEEYQVEAARCEQDVLSVLHDMFSKGLIQIK